MQFYHKLKIFTYAAFIWSFWEKGYNIERKRKLWWCTSFCLFSLDHIAWYVCVIRFIRWFSSWTGCGARWNLREPYNSFSLKYIFQCACEYLICICTYKYIYAQHFHSPLYFLTVHIKACSISVVTRTKKKSL